ncbi:uncharacterized protein LOC120341575 [Styela clava]
MATGGRSDDQHQAMISNAPGSFNEFKTHLDVCRSSSDVSDVSSLASSTFSVRNARVKLELARLKARQEEELSALEDDLRKLRTRHALQAAETELKVWEMSDDKFLRWVTVDRIRHDNSVKSRDFPPKSQLIDNGRENTPRRLPTLPTHTADSSSANPVPPRLNHALHRRTVDLPKPEIAKFSGDPMEYYSFIRNFKAHVTDLVDDDNVRLSYLLQLCQGEAKNAIDHCSMMEPSRGYREAMRELKNEYGKDRVISRTCLDRLKRGPKLNFDDAKGMQAYARLMRKCGLVLGEISEYDNLNNFDNLLAIVKRLPPESQNAWDFKVATILETEDREASYNDLSKFVTDQANVSRSDFRFARRDRRQSNYYENSKAKGSAFAISASGSNWHCPCCNFSHELFNCKKFKVLSWYERYNVARRNQLCFKCLRRGHMFRQCTQNESCPIHDCKYPFHHVLLHRDFETPTRRDGISKQTCSVGTSMNHADHDVHANKLAPAKQQGNTGIYMNIVPVTVTAGNRAFDTYALLDCASTTTMCSVKLMNKLNLTGVPIDVTLQTVGNRPKSVKAKKLSPLLVKEIDGHDDCIELPNVLCVSNLPIKPNKLPSRSSLRKLSYLSYSINSC